MYIMYKISLINMHWYRLVNSLKIYTLFEAIIHLEFRAICCVAGGGGGGANTKVPDMYGVGGCFWDPKHKSNMYTFVQQRGVSIFYPESQKYKWYFCTHIS